VEGMGEGVVKGDKSQGEKPCDATTNWRRRSERSWCDEAMEGDERGRGRATRQPTNDRLRRDQVEAVEGIERERSRATRQPTDEGATSRSRRRHHRCREFVGVEVSEDRAAEARSNVDRTRSTGTIPDHVSVDVMCANALDVDYARATVVFLYLVPRGLRLIRGAVWPTPMTTAAAAAGGGGGDVDVDDDDRGDGGADRGGRGDGVRVDATTTNATMAPSTMMITDDGRAPSKEDEGMSRETATTTRSVANWVR